MTQPETSNRFDRNSRLLNSQQYSRVFNRPFKSSDGAFTVLYIPNKAGRPRIGIVVAKKNVRLAVDRHRIKRVIRESFRISKSLLGRHDIVVLCKRNCTKLSNQKMSEQLSVHWKKISRHQQ